MSDLKNLKVKPFEDTYGQMFHITLYNEKGESKRISVSKECIEQLPEGEKGFLLKEGASGWDSNDYVPLEELIKNFYNKKIENQKQSLEKTYTDFITSERKYIVKDPEPIKISFPEPTPLSTLYESVIKDSYKEPKVKPKFKVFDFNDALLGEAVTKEEAISIFLERYKYSTKKDALNFIEEINGD